jgi:hypothetical protein
MRLPKPDARQAEILHALAIQLPEKQHDAGRSFLPSTPGNPNTKNPLLSHAPLQAKGEDPSDKAAGHAG